MISHRKDIAFALLFFFCLVSAIRAAEPGAPASAARENTEPALNRAVRFLLSKQDEKDGFIADQPINHTALTALSVLALASVGNQPVDNSPEGRAMVRAIRYVVRPENQDSSGYFGIADGSRMYGQGIITVMLGEMLGMGVDEETDVVMRRRLVKAVPVILKSQAANKSPGNTGGWRYTPDTNDADLSVTVWQVAALKSAKGAGIAVPAPAIESALGYVRNCYGNFVDTPGAPGGFSYNTHNANEISRSTSAMGLLALQLCGDFDSPACRGGTQYLDDNPPIVGDHWPMYGMYYYSQAMYQAGGDHWAKARSKVTQRLLSEQQADGSWSSRSQTEKAAGAVFTTSVGVLTLAVKYHYLPIYQR